MLGVEELLRAVDRELLDLVDDLAAAVVAPTGIALRVLVRRDAADGLEHRRPREVLRGDELDLAALPLELALQERGHLGIDVCEAGRPQLLERHRLRGHVAGCYFGCHAAREPRPRGRRPRGARAARSGQVDHRRRCSREGRPRRGLRRRRRGSPRDVADRLGSAPPCRFALVAATTPTRARSSAARPVTSGCGRRSCPAGRR